MTQTYTIGRYLTDRLAELGIRHIFGVPGDYNLSFLDTIVQHPALEWVGNCNELNAAYAADGYARLHGIAALVTTYGVGELSAVNGIAGAYAEEVPVVKITGSPTTKVTSEGRLVHHTLGDGDFQHFTRMYQEVTAASAILNADTACEEIDRLLRICVNESRPVYMNLPVDVHGLPADPPIAPLLNEAQAAQPKVKQELLDALLPAIEQAKTPVILADYQVDRFHAQQALQHIAKESGFPVATLSMGKGIYNEEDAQFIGVYSGKTSPDYLRQRVDTADCVLLVGVKLTDSITSGFSQGFNQDAVIAIEPNKVIYQGKEFNGIRMEETLELLAEHLQPRASETLNLVSLSDRVAQKGEPFYFEPTRKLEQDRFWKMMTLFIQENDVVIADQGTSYFGSETIPLKKGVSFVGQPLWGSIGYTLPALLGTQLANQERRNILLIGDGAFQLTFQELSTMIRLHLHPVIFAINNDGYTVERSIHGPEECYNDIQMWHYNQIPAVFGADNQVKSYQITTEGEMAEALKDMVAHPDNLRFAEVIMEKMDMPKLLSVLGKIFAAQND
ncbi:MAG: alpha-keto acid decarboxylase family protein [Sporolactobacillus sp.]